VPETSFIPLLIVVGAAVVTGAVLPRLPWVRVPVVVGEILTGILLGKSGLALIPVPSPEHPQPWLELLSLFGFTFLMFLSGLEIDVRSISVAITGEHAGQKDTGSMRALLLRTFTIFGATLLVSLLLSEGLVLAGLIDTPYVMALIMSTTSVGLVMPLLKERGEADSTFGQTVILSAVVADFVTMLLITVVVAFYEHHELTLDLLVFGTLFLVFFALYWVGKKLLHREESIVKRLAFAAPRTAELPVRASLTMMLLFVVLSQYIGSEIILGAFLAGALVSALSPKTAHGLLGMKLDAIGFGLFIPIFFIMVGVQFDIGSLLEDRSGLLLVPILVGFAFVVKVVPSLLLAKFFGRRNAIAAGFLISSRLSLIIAASAIGLRLGVITEAVNSAIILVAIITCVVSPAVYASLRRVEARGAHVKPVDLDPLLGHVISRKKGRSLALQLVELDADRFPFLVGKTLAETRLRQETGLTLIEVVHSDGTVVENPGGDYCILPADSLFLVGTDAQIRAIEALAVEVRKSLVPPPA
jgi:Kef-type K+ transport system membrane component KefB